MKREIKMEQLQLQSSKIKCGGCVANIEKGLSDFSGITEIKVDVETNIVELKGTAMIQADIETKLAQLGYPIV